MNVAHACWRDGILAHRIIDVRHVPGKLNVIADGLSRQWEGQPRNIGLLDGSDWTVEGSTILLASRTMLGECCLAAIQPKGFWTKLRGKRERVCVCVCVRERERERENKKVSLQTMRIRLCIRSCIVSY